MRDPASVVAPKSAKSNVNAQVIDDFWELPQRLRSPEISEAEMEAITVRSTSVRVIYSLAYDTHPDLQSGGASLH
ncbi:hypothetical protein NM688_g3231 [Phlebia brevispora]|uniref:Uncharacterized protein n=1 Tax=Phlebia brevispora TaxID=194682 RepID=A0ACC1T6F5_9APHY|nr:hypothetical protein NM688_g3231 [Phlebia brevispora]